MNYISNTYFISKDFIERVTFGFVLIKGCLNLTKITFKTVSQQYRNP
ncbi:unnamed protein product [Paramecium octaurelia]|uniref:Uncharacterized protein n=1 Tax=Paramecium octaurelia TaxID=43137 RepID=A0A8S1VJB3_PAROT|nr:unnamed protein product [Paramecium octaurelia]